MNNRTKKMILIGVIAIIAIIIIVMVVGKGKEKKKEPQNTIKQEEYTIQNTDGNKVNTSEALKTPRKELSYYVSNITLEKQGAKTIFKLKLTNQTNNVLKGKLVDIVFLGKNGEEEAKMGLYIREIKAGETISTEATVHNDFTNVYNFKLVERQTNT